jgi:hypothetical protein
MSEASSISTEGPTGVSVHHSGEKVSIEGVSASGVTEKKEPEKKVVLPKVKDWLRDVAGSPEQEVIEQWKSEYGEVYSTGFDKDELYIWRPLSRSEYIQLQLQMQQQDPENPVDYELVAVEMCLLWPQGCDLGKKAGTVSTLHEHIMQNSNFIPVQVSGYLIAKL